MQSLHYTAPTSPTLCCQLDLFSLPPLETYCELYPDPVHEVDNTAANGADRRFSADSSPCGTSCCPAGTATPPARASPTVLSYPAYAVLVSGESGWSIHVRVPAGTPLPAPDQEGVDLNVVFESAAGVTRRFLCMRGQDVRMGAQERSMQDLELRCVLPPAEELLPVDNRDAEQSSGVSAHCHIEAVNERSQLLWILRLHQQLLFPSASMRPATTV
jgi:hypothetical protein